MFLLSALTFIATVHPIETADTSVLNPNEKLAIHHIVRHVVDGVDQYLSNSGDVYGRSVNKSLGQTVRQIAYLFETVYGMSLQTRRELSTQVSHRLQCVGANGMDLSGTFQGFESVLENDLADYAGE